MSQRSGIGAVEVVGGAAVGLVAVGATATVLARRFAAFRRRDAEADTVFGRRHDPNADGVRVDEVSTDDGLPLQVEQIGPDEASLTVVFSHGYTLTSDSWYYQRAELAPLTGRSLRLLFYDQRGHGESPWGDPELATIDQIADDLARILTERVPTGRIVLVGHSMGGMAIMGLAERRPELFGPRIVGVALLSTSTGNLASVGFGLPQAITGLSTAVLPLIAKLARQRPQVAERTRRLGKDIAFLATKRMTFSGREVTPGLASYVDRMIASTPADVIGAFFPALAGLDKSGVLGPLENVATLILCGDADRTTPKAHSELLAEQLPGSELVIINDSGHLAQMERPDIVNEHLRAFLRRCARRKLRPAPAVGVDAAGAVGPGNR
ncbi:MAG: alpha/beta hydrolase [Geodermatophilaceae bacterium]|nr:alpha/beta hydrolase [Geodermatophilaceae bacterium]